MVWYGMVQFTIEQHTLLQYSISLFTSIIKHKLRESLGEMMLHPSSTIPCQSILVARGSSNTLLTQFTLVLYLMCPPFVCVQMSLIKRATQNRSFLLLLGKQASSCLHILHNAAPALPPPYNQVGTAFIHLSLLPVQCVCYA